MMLRTPSLLHSRGLASGLAPSGSELGHFQKDLQGGLGTSDLHLTMSVAQVVSGLLVQMENKDFAAMIRYQLQPLHQDAQEEILLV
ncbi:hypothetical protein TURU_037053 [Turdus rufiventris]|nr:hypothetical protein TURU_037053 [Turdus rufiventris]